MSNFSLKDLMLKQLQDKNEKHELKEKEIEQMFNDVEVGVGEVQKFMIKRAGENARNHYFDKLTQCNVMTTGGKTPKKEEDQYQIIATIIQKRAEEEETKAFDEAIKKCLLVALNKLEERIKH